MAAFAGGCVRIGWDNWTQEQFYPAPLQLVAAGALTLALIVVGWRLPRRSPLPRRSRLPGVAPSPVRVFVAVAMITGGYSMVPLGWGGFAAAVALICLGVGLVDRWSRRPGWSGQHVVAVAAGALSTAAWGAFLVGDFIGMTDGGDPHRQPGIRGRDPRLGVRGLGPGSSS